MKLTPRIFRALQEGRLTPVISFDAQQKEREIEHIYTIPPEARESNGPDMGGILRDAMDAIYTELEERLRETGRVPRILHVHSAVVGHLFTLTASWSYADEIQKQENTRSAALGDPSEAGAVSAGTLQVFDEIPEGWSMVREQDGWFICVKE